MFSKRETFSDSTYRSGVRHTVVKAEMREQGNYIRFRTKRSAMIWTS